MAKPDSTRGIKISVCMAAYNGARYIKEQIASILPQLGEEDELIISDDGSTDNTTDIISGFNDSRILLVKNEGNHGFTSNFENALKRASGDIIFLTDQDDIWNPGKVERAVELLSNADLIVHDAEIIDGDGNDKGINYFSFLHNHTGFLWNLYKTRFLGCCMVFKRNVLDAALPFPADIVAHDYWIGMLALYRFKVLFSDEKLMKYRRHGDNVSSSGEKSRNSLFYKIFTKRYVLMKNLIRCGKK